MHKTYFNIYFWTEIKHQFNDKLGFQTYTFTSCEPNPKSFPPP